MKMIMLPKPMIVVARIGTIQWTRYCAVTKKPAGSRMAPIGRSCIRYSGFMPYPRFAACFLMFRYSINILI